MYDVFFTYFFLITVYWAIPENKFPDFLEIGRLKVKKKYVKKVRRSSHTKHKDKSVGSMLQISRKM